ncbi:MAG: response regulator transcription factor [Terriglobia bacterium]
MKTLRILVADDHEVVRQGMRALLEIHPGWEVCAEAANGREAIELAKQTKPDVVVMDISMPELNGLDATRQILKALPRTEVLILTLHESEQLVRRVVESGARAYVLKSDAGRSLVEGVAALSRHKGFFSSKVATLLVESNLNRGKTTGRTRRNRDLLTPREREVVQLLAEGKSNKEIGVTLGLSVHTAETHRSNIMRKLGTHSLSDLIRYALRNKIVQF